MAIGRAGAEGRGVKKENGARKGAKGRRTDGAMGLGAERGGQNVGENDRVLMAADEQITLSHRALDRRVFARGALMAARWLSGRPAGLYSMADALR